MCDLHRLLRVGYTSITVLASVRFPTFYFHFLRLKALVAEKLLQGLTILILAAFLCCEVAGLQRDLKK